MSSPGPRTTIKITGGAASVVLCAVFLIILYHHARKGELTAIIILVALAVIGLTLMGAAITMGIIMVAEKIRSRQFQENAVENQRLMLAQHRVQNELTRGALMLAREQQRMLPSGPTGGYALDDALALVDVDETIFDEIYDGE